MPFKRLVLKIKNFGLSVTNAILLCCVAFVAVAFFSGIQTHLISKSSLQCKFWKCIVRKELFPIHSQPYLHD